MGLTDRRVQQIERKEAVGIYAVSLRSLATSLGESLKAITDDIEFKPEFDQNVDVGSEQHVPEIPLFEWRLAAGPWVELEGEGQVCDPQQKDIGLFRVRLRGDSMTAPKGAKPNYPDGTIVEFRCLRDGRHVLEVGKDYYVQKRDGTATFKRLARIDEETLELAALNVRKYPHFLVVERSEIVRMAVKVAVVDLGD